jgi:serine/threonine-protein phosphatase PP1 catalytic subunit
MFGNDVIEEFCRLLQIDLIVRAHEVVKDGHAFSGEHNQLCTIFSAPNYCGVDGNNASVMKIDGDMKITFVTLKPHLDVNKLSAESKIELDRIAATINVKSPKP